MSRSCQRATFSRPAWAYPRSMRASPVIRSEMIGLRLCGIALEPFWPVAERLLDLAHLGALEMADLGGEPLEAAPAIAIARQELGVPVPRNDLRRDVLRAEAELAPGPLPRSAGGIEE